MQVAGAEEHQAAWELHIHVAPLTTALCLGSDPALLKNAQDRSAYLQKRRGILRIVNAHRRVRCVEQVDGARVIVARIRAIREVQIRGRRPQVGQIAQLLERVIECRIGHLSTAQRLRQTHGGSMRSALGSLCSFA